MRRRTWLLAGLFALAACSNSGDRSTEPGRSATRLPEPSAATGGPVDEALMVALGQAKNFHHKAEVYLKDGRIDEAIAEVRNVLSIRFPDNAPEGEDVRLDARAKLAKLLVMKGDTAGAMKVIDEGLAGSPRESFFLANLYTVQGEVHEAAAAALAESDPAASQERLKQALQSYDTSIQINQRLQKRLYDEARP